MSDSKLSDLNPDFTAVPAPTFLFDATANVHVSLTHESLSLTNTVDFVRSPKAGAIVLFAGTVPFSLHDAASKAPRKPRTTPGSHEKAMRTT
jgi:hypothetical protein